MYIPQSIFFCPCTYIFCLLIFSRDRGTKSDREESENEYLTTSLRADPPVPLSTASRSSPAALSYVRYDQEQDQYAGGELSITSMNIRQGQGQANGQMQGYQMLGQGQGQGQGQRQMYVSAGRQGSGPNRPNSAALETNRNWTDTMLPSVKVGKHMNGNNLASINKAAPSSSSTARVEIRPRSKSATVGRRPGPSLPSPGAIYRDQTRQTNPAAIFVGSGITNNYSQNQKNRTSSGDDLYGTSNGNSTRLSSAGTSRKSTTTVGKTQNIKLSDSSLSTPKIGVADQNRTARDMRRNSANYNQVPLAPKEVAKEEKLAFMYGNDVINRLDSIVTGR